MRLPKRTQHCQGPNLLDPGPVDLFGILPILLQLSHCSLAAGTFPFGFIAKYQSGFVSRKTSGLKTCTPRLHHVKSHAR